MYIVEIPQECKNKIKEILIKQRASYSLRFPPNDLDYLATIYYRYVEPLRRGETVESKVKYALSCPNCIGKITYYFKTESNTWG